MRKYLAKILSAFLLCLMVSCGSETASAVSIAYPPDGVYSFQPKCSPKAELATDNQRCGDGINVVIAPYSATAPKWRITRINNSQWYKITVDGSNIGLNVDNGRRINGTNITLWTYGGAWQQFRFLDHGDGYYSIQGNIGGSENFVMDVANGTSSTSANVWNCYFYATDAQKWKLVNVDKNQMNNNISTKKGDINGDGKIDNSDVSLLRTYVIQKKYIASGDMDDDGRVDISDVSDLSQLVGKNTPKVQGALEVAESQEPNQLIITGWAFSREDLTHSVLLHVYVGGPMGSNVPSYKIRAGKSRPDIGRTFPGVGNLHGFDEKINVNPGNTGNQTVYVYATSDDAGGNWIEIGHKQVNIKSSSNNPQGYLDVAESQAPNQLTIVGWAFDRDDVNHKVRVHVYVGGPVGSNSPSYEIKADKSRIDVEKAFPGVGDYHGFDSKINVDPEKTGNQMVYVYALNDVGGGNWVEIGHKEVNIKASFQPYQDTARQTVPAFMDAALTQRTGNERVDAGDVVTVLKKEGNSFFVDYPAGNSRKQRWVDKKIFEQPSISTKIDDAMRYIASLEGRAMDYDGAYGAQCVDLIKYYYKYFGVANYARGNGKDYATNTLPPGWQRIKGAVPQKGDILVYTSGGGGYGHVAIAESPNVSWHQNFNGKYVRKITGNYNSIHVGYWGVIRPVI